MVARTLGEVLFQVEDIVALTERSHLVHCNFNNFDCFNFLTMIFTSTLIQNPVDGHFQTLSGKEVDKM